MLSKRKKNITKNKKSQKSSINKISNNIKSNLNDISKKTKVSKKNLNNIVIKLSDLKKELKKLCIENNGKYNKKKEECHINVSHLLNDIHHTFKNSSIDTDFNKTDMDNFVIIMDEIPQYNSHFPILTGGNSPNNYNIPKDVLGCQGGVNGCNNQRLVYDSQGIIGCNQPFGIPSQGGQSFNYPKYIVSK